MGNSEPTAGLSARNTAAEIMSLRIAPFRGIEDEPDIAGAGREATARGGVTRNRSDFEEVRGQRIGRSAEFEWRASGTRRGAGTADAARRRVVHSLEPRRLSVFWSR